MRTSSLGIYLVLAGMLYASPAAAQSRQTSPPQDKAVAVALAERGWDHYQAHRYTEALRAFREAEAKAHAPAFLLMVARCNVKLGRLLDARAAYQLIVDEKLSPGAPREFAEAKAEAKKELADLETRIPTVEVAVTGAAPGKLDVTLAGEQIALSAPVRRGPGHYPLTVRAPGRGPLVRTIWLVEGARERIEIDQAAIDALPPADLYEAPTGHHGPLPSFLPVMGSKPTFPKNARNSYRYSIHASRSVPLSIREPYRQLPVSSERGPDVSHPRPQSRPTHTTLPYPSSRLSAAIPIAPASRIPTRSRLRRGEGTEVSTLVTN